MAKKSRSRKTGRKKASSPKPTPALGIGALVVVVIAATLFILMRPTHPEFEADSAFSYLSELLEFGPRNPGSDSHQAALAWMISELDERADQVTQQAVTIPLGGDTLRGTNVIASFNLSPDRNARVMLSAHWDTRPWADQDPDSSYHTEPIIGANDGGSGVAVLLEIARAMSEAPPEIGVDLILFDLEDSGQDSTVAFALGSEYFAENSSHYRPSFGINVDMVCDHDLEILQEANSLQGAGHVVRMIWDAAESEGADAFVNARGPAVFDDHAPFLARGIPVVDLIHAPFPSYWHTMGDTIDKCSAESLAQVGNVLLRVIYQQ